MRYRIVFFGTPHFAVPSLAALIEGADEVVGLVCQADRPAGRGQKMQAPPTKELALEHGIPVAQPRTLRGGDFSEQLATWKPDLIIVAAYGRILPTAILTLPQHGCINVHASLLPKYRGAAPIQWAIACGEQVTGITIMQMNEEMDAGDILLVRETPIGAAETGGELSERLANLGATALQQALESLAAENLEPSPQDHANATFAPKIKKADGLIDWTSPALDIANRCRAFNPWPSIYTRHAGKLLKIHRAEARMADHTMAPGVVISCGETIDIATGQGTLAIRELQAEGRKRLQARDFSRGGALQVGTRLGTNKE